LPKRAGGGARLAMGGESACLGTVGGLRCGMMGPCGGDLAGVTVLVRQASRDFTSWEELELTGSSSEAAERKQEAWKAMAERFLKRAPPPADAEPPQKRFRCKAHELLVASQNQLVVVTGRGYEAFMVPAEIGEAGDAAEWPQLTLCLDQGPDGWASQYFFASEAFECPRLERSGTQALERRFASRQRLQFMDSLERPNLRRQLGLRPLGAKPGGVVVISGRFGVGV